MEDIGPTLRCEKDVAIMRVLAFARIHKSVPARKLASDLCALTGMEMKTCASYITEARDHGLPLRILLEQITGPEGARVPENARMRQKQTMRKSIRMAVATLAAAFGFGLVADANLEDSNPSHDGRTGIVASHKPIASHVEARPVYDGHSTKLQKLSIGQEWMVVIQNGQDWTTWSVTKEEFESIRDGQRWTIKNVAEVPILGTVAD